MALYKQTGGSFARKAEEQSQGARATWGRRQPEGQRTETEGTRPGAGQIINQGIGLLNVPNQLEGAWNSVKNGTNSFMQWLNAPNATSGVAETGGNAVADTASGISDAVQLNTGAEVAGALQDQMYAVPEYLGGEAGLAQASEQTASQITGSGANTANAAQAGANAAAGGMTTMGAVAGPAIGGAAGGLAGRELGRAIGGDTGAAIGGVAGSLGGAYLGGLAGSAVPGVGTLIGAGIGALSSLFL